ncbi:MAG: GHKL domain-containing protein [Bacilli bacterium]|nr:GHKL domain-containing protein [Bacilli bacterium]
MEYFLNYFGHLVFAFGLFVGGEVMILRSSSSRPHLPLRIAFCLALLLGGLAGLVFTEDWQKSVFLGFPILTSFYVGITFIIFLAMTTKVDKWRIIYGVSGGMMFQFITSAPSKMIIMFHDKNAPVYLTWPISIGMTVLLGFGLYVLTRKLFKNPDDFQSAPGTTAYMMIFAFCVAHLPLLEDAAFLYNHYAYVGLIVVEIILCTMAIVSQMATCAYYQKEFRDALSAKLKQKESENFALYRDVVRATNIKIHDIKHQIHDAAKGRTVDQDYLEELSKTIDSYDAFVKTGNETIDLVLTEKHHICQKKGIELVCMLDGTLFSFLDPYEINSLFGNILENAINALQDEEEGKRYISLTTKTLGDIFTLHIENYCTKEVHLGKDGLPKTQKDPMLHGFGMQSIHDIVMENNGELRCFQRSNAFHIDILLPKK